MKKRILSAVLAIALIVAVILAGKLAIGITVFLLALIGILEFYRALGKGGFKPIYPAGILSCLFLLYIVIIFNIPDNAGSGAISGGYAVLRGAALGLFALIVFSFCLLIFSGGRYNVADISVTVFGIIYVVFLLSFVTLTGCLEKGNLYIWMIIIGACATDTFAYFTGVTIGKTKILPRVSPKKTVEGCIGGVLGCILAMVVFGLCSKGSLDMAIYHFIVLGGICGVVSQLGDWAASAVKRAVNIKDYGSVMPGHGGVMDRLDSVMFVAPVIYFYISIFLY